MRNHNTNNRLFIARFDNEEEALDFIKEKNVDPQFEYYVAK